MATTSCRLCGQKLQSSAAQKQDLCFSCAIMATEPRKSATKASSTASSTIGKDSNFIDMYYTFIFIYFPRLFSLLIYFVLCIYCSEVRETYDSAYPLLSRVPPPVSQQKQKRREGKTLFFFYILTYYFTIHC